MPPTGFVMMTYDTCVHFIFFCFWRKVKGLRHERDESSRERPLRQQIQTIMLSQGAWPPESSWVAERVSCGLQGQHACHKGQHAFHSNYNCCLKRSRTVRPSGKYWWFLVPNNALLKRGCLMAKNKNKNEALRVADDVCVCVGGRSPSRRVSGATAAAAVQQRS